MVAQSVIEQQLKDRSIPYFTQYPRQGDSQGAPRSRSALSGMIPTLVVNVADLLRDARAAEVAMPRVFVQITDWWKGGKCSVSWTWSGLM